MSTYDSPLKTLRIASPCSADWDGMSGDARKRFCRECKLNVYNLSDMTWYDAENLLRLSEGRLCVRYFQRADGTILTQDCPVGWAKVKQRISIFAATAFSMIISLFSVILFMSSFGRKPEEAIVGVVTLPRATPTPKTVPLLGVMGNVAVPTSTPKPKPLPYREKLGKVAVGVPAMPRA